jgi:hypothetical protein
MECKTCIKTLKLRMKKNEREFERLEMDGAKQELPGHVVNALSSIREAMKLYLIQLEAKWKDEDYFAFFHSPLQDMAGAMKASFHQKIEHRFLIIILHPNRQSMLNEVSS